MGEVKTAVCLVTNAFSNRIQRVLSMGESKPAVRPRSSLLSCARRAGVADG